MPDWKRIGLGIWTGGLSEAAGYDKVNDWLFGGKATKDMPTGPQTGDYQRSYLQDFAQRQAPTMNTQQSDQSRGQQNQLASMLFGQATGATPGAGEMAVNRQVGQAQSNQTALASMARGANAGMAGRNAARAGAELGVNGAGMAAQAQMQDQQNAQGQLNSLLGNMRTQDINVAGANQAAQMQQQQLQISALAQMLGVDEAQLRQDLAKRGLQMQDKGMLPGLLQMGGSMGVAAASDERLKTDIVDADEQVDEMLAELQPKAYSYKNEKHGRGPRVGIMAQDLERSEMGRDIVDDTDEGKMLDVNKALSLALAAVARLDKRVRQLEGRE